MKKTTEKYTTKFPEHQQLIAFFLNSNQYQIQSVK